MQTYHFNINIHYAKWRYARAVNGYHRCLLITLVLVILRKGTIWITFCNRPLLSFDVLYDDNSCFLVLKFIKICGIFHIFKTEKNYEYSINRYISEDLVYFQVSKLRLLRSFESKSKCVKLYPKNVRKTNPKPGFQSVINLDFGFGKMNGFPWAQGFPKPGFQSLVPAQGLDIRGQGRGRRSRGQGL